MATRKRNEKIKNELCELCGSWNIKKKQQRQKVHSNKKGSGNAAKSAR